MLPVLPLSLLPFLSSCAFILLSLFVFYILSLFFNPVQSFIHGLVTPIVFLLSPVYRLIFQQSSACCLFLTCRLFFFLNGGVGEAEKVTVEISGACISLASYFLRIGFLHALHSQQYIIHFYLHPSL